MSILITITMVNNKDYRTKHNREGKRERDRTIPQLVKTIIKIFEFQTKRTYKHNIKWLNSRNNKGKKT